MPQRQKHFCNHPGCPELVRGRPYCDQHARKDDRPSPSARGYDWEWRKTRAAYLAEHPRCERCGAPATEVHHKDEDTDNNDWDNLEALCKPCHSRETASRG
ncbi:MAG: HNH endonuclease signature motif containing protein [Actinomycetota bacterium]|nr:HNH endonuclease signature motif containing protein [Actinomycetota bacterium]